MYIGSDYNANATSQPTSNPATYYWRATSLGPETVQIEPTDDHACTPPCSYYIGVLAFSSNASYAISAYTSSAAGMELILGQPVSGTVEAQTINRYAAYFNATNGPLEIIVTPDYGDPDLYVRLDNTTVTQYNGQV